MTKPKKPTVQLTGNDGNAMNILALCRRALREAGYTGDQVEQFTAEATSGDYDKILQTAMKWCEVV